MEQKHLTPAAVRIIQAFLVDPTHRFYATELMETARIGSGSLYPALARMEKAGWVVSQSEDIDPREKGRPARHYYSMTGEGVREAHIALVNLSESVLPPASSPGWLLGPAPRGVSTT
ncbi:PadR family transcriptional regulator [Streptomyces alfalfae]|uniref:PadR family transcriptional regulator n=1 Tax=Streptomyces alfalfae TaxID=1642299 RepID=A0A7T4PDS5_9ACTN|nr:PadR family transcriptional regulator [Streptomyces alfalfae]QQC88183.1 PadR family transcriptional regulator [Streptomyces alfalfae]